MITTLTDFNIRHNNTFGMDVSCRKWIEYTSARDLSVIFADLRADKLSYLPIGAGSNLLFTCDFNGALLHSRILDVEMTSGENGVILLRAGSGVELDSLILQTASAGLWGLENLSGIPGEVGASAVQNVGAYGVEACDVIESIECYDIQEGNFVKFRTEECNYAYRDSRFKHFPDKGKYIITYVTYRLSSKPKPIVEYGHLRSRIGDLDSVSPLDIREAIKSMRDEKLPSVLTTGSAGSFFKNPIISATDFENLIELSKTKFGEDEKVPHYELPTGYKIPAAWLIEKSGLKGYSSGNAATWFKQPLVIVNKTGKATPEEIIALENLIINEVNNVFGIELHPEVEHVGLSK